MLLFLFLAATPATAPGLTDIEELSLGDLVDPPISVATKTELKASATPSIVTVIEREEIVRSGAQDLLEVLRWVPGFQIGLDVDGVVSIGVRGLWAHEGKVALLVDGLELNEILYSTVQIGGHIPVAQIQRIEIIRGPGSAIYGGYAELAVINVITRRAADLDGFSASANYGQLEKAPGRGSATLAGGKRVGEWDLSLQTTFGRGNRSDQKYTDFSGNSFVMAGQSTIGDLMINAAAKWRDVSARVVYDDYEADTRDGYGPAMSNAIAQHFRTLLADVRDDTHLSEKLSLTSRLFYKYQTPWQVFAAGPQYYDKSAQRALTSVTLSWQPVRALDFLAGGEGYWDDAWLNDAHPDPSTYFTGGHRAVSYENVAAFVQGILTHSSVNATAGARFEYNSQYGASFVPRFALTKDVWRFNFKLLYALAFRSPGIENININPTIQPERTQTLEAEIGYAFFSGMKLSVNGFWGRIDRPIIYGADPATLADDYYNAGHTGSSGVEAEYRFQYGWGQLRCNYSFYTAAGQNDVATYAVAGHGDLLKGFAAHKVALLSSFDLWRDNLQLAVNGSFTERRYGVVANDAAGNSVQGSLPEQVIVGVTLFYRHLFVRGLDLGVGVNNATGQIFRVVQPYDGGHAPLPLTSREVFVQASYAWSGR